MYLYISFQAEYADNEDLVPQASSFVVSYSLVPFRNVVFIFSVVFLSESGRDRWSCVSTPISILLKLSVQIHLSCRMAGSIFANQLHSKLMVYSPGISPEDENAVLQSVTAIMQLPPSLRPGVLQAYSKSLAPVFLSALPGGILASLSAL